MITKIDLCSMALLKIGEKPIQSFNEDTAPAQLARTLFENVTDSMLAAHPWKFATKKCELVRTDDNDFLLPVEVLRVLSCDARDYEINGNRILSKHDKITVIAVIRIVSESYPAFFSSLAATKLAMEFCMPLTDNQNCFNTLAALYDSELRAAKFIDSTMASSTSVADFSLISARF
ncbi:MAG: hypothetical protein FWF34_00690 [Alphaproteobacteria bacterium]|nr:hypothetical protein [Alphaproteobacteria bacterium]MCL2889763.1 hypothetical protein [Alphaproteobacteria bacterium]